VNDTVTTRVGDDSRPAQTLDLLDSQLPTYDVVLTEHLVVEADTAVVFEAARGFDFMTTSRLVTALMTARSVPSRLMGRPVVTPQRLMLATEPGTLPGWLVLGEVPGRELVFAAVGTFWTPDIEWRDDLAPDDFASFEEPGWGKIACHLLVRPDGPDRSVLSYECRTATTDPASQAQMSRYWWLIRPFVAHVLRAVLRTIRANVDARV
jgi:hypothetical protein